MSRSSASFSESFKVFSSLSEASAAFPNANKIVPVVHYYPYGQAAPAATAVTTANKLKTAARLTSTENFPLTFPVQPAQDGMLWYSPFTEFPPDCAPAASSCSSSSLSSTCAAPCITSTDWYWQDIDPGNEYEPDTDYIIEPAQLPSTICPGDYITFNITPTSAGGYGDYGIDLSFSWAGVTPGQQLCFTLVSYSPGLQYNGDLNYPPPTAFDFGWGIYWGISGGIYDPPYPKVTTYSVTVQYTGNCCVNNYNQTIGSFVLYGGDRDRYRVADVICCESGGSSIAVPYTVPGWRSNTTSCPPEDCISIGGEWKSPFLDEPPPCESSDDSESDSASDCVGGVTVLPLGTGYQSGGNLWDITASSYNMSNGNWSVTAVANVNAGSPPGGATATCNVAANAASSPAVTSCTGVGPYSQGQTITVSGTSTPPTSVNCGAWAIQAQTFNITNLTFGFFCSTC
jgi:hypothetical protein